MTESGRSQNKFEADKPGTNARTAAEAAIEDLRQRGGVFVEAVRATRMPMAVTDPNLPGNPIVFANESFLKLSGYRMEDVLGQQPHFMNGRETDPQDAARFEEAIRADHDDLVETVQYRKDGSRFVASVLISAFKDDEGRTLNHFMSWLDITRRTNAESELNLLKQVEAALRESDRQRSAMFDVLPLGLALIDLEGKEILSNPEWNRFIRTQRIPSRDKERGERWRSWDQQGVPVAAENFPGARALRGEHVHPPMEFLYTDDSGREIWTNVAAVPLRGDKDEIVGAICIIQDIDAAKRAESALRESERRAKTLLAELQHRVRNILAMLRSVVRRTGLSKDNVGDFVEHLQGRIDAMARTQAMLTRAPGKGVDLEDLIRDEMVAQSVSEQRYSIRGSTVALSPQAAEIVTLALHELATNSVKYGVFGQGGGKVTISWTCDQQQEPKVVNLAWRESGIDVQARGEPGFGTELITQRVPYELKGQASLDMDGDTLTALIEFPLQPSTSIFETEPARANGGGE